MTVVAATAVFAVAACSTPEYRYVTNSTTGTYLKVPHSWAEYKQSQLVDAEADAARKAQEQTPTAVDSFLDQLAQWRVAFDADPVPSPEHAIQVTSEAPIVDVRVLALNDLQRDQFSMSDLRNLFVPYDKLKKEAEEEAAQKPVLTPTVTTKFRSISEEELAPEGGLRGIRLQFELRSQPPEDTVYLFDQTALLDSKTQRLYVLLIRGSEKEFLDHSEALNAVAESFTVKPKDS